MATSCALGKQKASLVGRASLKEVSKIPWWVSNGTMQVDGTQYVLVTKGQEGYTSQREGVTTRVCLFHPLSLWNKT